MIYTGKQQRYQRSLPVAVFIISCLFLLLLLSTIQRDVFFSGDGGLKYLVTIQNHQPVDYTALHLKTENWVNDIWRQGFYPFKAPFVYDSIGKKIVSFPPFFQQLSAPVYKTAGYGGLYIVPVISIVLLWSWFAWLLYSMRIKPHIVAAALFCLACCSPLTLYAAVYWEHTLAVLLLFGGIVFLVKPARNPFVAAALGGLTGLSAWLRPEALLLCMLIAAMIGYNQFRQRSAASLSFVISLFTVIVLFFICNRFLYGNFLGAHSYQLFIDTSPADKLYASLVLLVHLNAKQFMFFPLSILVFAGALYALVKKAAIPEVVLQLLVITIVFSFAAPFFLPNAGGKQWGPRYFLFLIPIVMVAAAIFTNNFFSTSVVSKTGLWLIIPVIAYSAYLNGYMAFKTLHDDYAYRVKPGLQWMLHNPCKVVVVQNQFIAQEFAALFQTKNIFLAENESEYTQLKSLLQTAQVREIIFISRDKSLLLPYTMHEAGAGSIKHLGDYYLIRCNWPY